MTAAPLPSATQAESPVDQRSSRLAIGFSCAGHAAMHILTGLYLTVVLGIERDWQIGYETLIALWSVGSLLIGLGAPLAGWLSDRWSQTGMMVVFFLLTGCGALTASLADSELALAIGLGVIGLGGSIYHPVGIAWLVRHAERPGRMIGINGIFGSLGIGSAALIAGTLTELFGWRAAFWLPGAICLALGLALLLLWRLRLIMDSDTDRKPQPKPAEGAMMRTFLVLSVTMLASGLIFQGTQTALPKWFQFGLDGLFGGAGGIDPVRVGLMVTLVYVLTSPAQFLGGLAADKVDARRVYVAVLAVQIPLILLAAGASDWALLILAVGMIFANAFQLPTESVLLARFTPAKHRGLAFGAKFILSFGTGPIAVALVGLSYAYDQSFAPLMLFLAGCAALAATAALFLPKPGDTDTAALPAAAE